MQSFKTRTVVENRIKEKKKQSFVIEINELENKSKEFSINEKKCV